jgi:site-specific DNA recombinase
MPALRNREQMLRSELQSIIEQITDRAAFLRLAETLTAFLGRLGCNAETLDVAERQRMVRLVVKETLVGENDITIRHSIPIPLGSPPNGGLPRAGDPNYFCVRGVASSMLAKLYTNRLLKGWRNTKRGEQSDAHIVTYPDDFVILSRREAAESLNWTRQVVARMGESP